MQLHGHHNHHKQSEHVVNPHPGPATVRGIELALFRAEQALHAGRLLTPGEAAALAGPDARGKETLFSIARNAAWETEGDMDDILWHLDEKFPNLAK